MIKLCVGADTPADLVAWRARRAAEGHKPIVHTRQTPKRAGEILDGGSLYWVFKGQILIRQPILAIETIADAARTRCEILLGDDMIATVPQPRRAFQGWRYFQAKDAPPDLAGQDVSGLPQELARQLREIGAW
jgi:hypothetical protein